MRDFRIVRIRDARQGNRPALRSGMLNVWDARALGEGALQQGKRYLVSCQIRVPLAMWPSADRIGSKCHAWQSGRMAGYQAQVRWDLARDLSAHPQGYSVASRRVMQ